MGSAGKNVSTEYVSLLEIVHKPCLPSVDNWRAAVFWFCASLPLFSVLSTLCPLNGYLIRQVIRLLNGWRKGYL